MENYSHHVHAYWLLWLQRERADENLHQGSLTIILTIDGVKQQSKFSGELDRCNKATGIGVAEFPD